jgi:hypothetical protein
LFFQYLLLQLHMRGRSSVGWQRLPVTQEVMNAAAKKSPQLYETKTSTEATDLRQLERGGQEPIANSL